MRCSVEGCNKALKYLGMCGMHYKRWWRHGDVHYCDNRTTITNFAKCLVEDCEERGAWKGYCPIHYNRMYKYNRTYRVIAPRGCGTINSGGYIVLTVNGRRVYEHVLIAEKALGRKLPLDAVVHHIDLDPSNNDPNNLVICPDQAYHMELHMRMRWGRPI